MDHWDKRFMVLADEIANWSKDPNCQVGAVLISPDKTKISYGFNGFPRKIADDLRLTSLSKNSLMVHAELNAILNAKTDVSGWSLYCTKFPCSDCAKAVIQAGIIRIVHQSDQSTSESKWFQSHATAMALFDEAEIEVVSCT